MFWCITSEPGRSRSLHAKLFLVHLYSSSIVTYDYSDSDFELVGFFSSPLTFIADTRLHAAVGRCFQDLRAGRYPKVNSLDNDVAHTANVLGLPPEPTNTGVTLLSADTVEVLLTDRRQVGETSRASKPTVGARSFRFV